MIEYIFINMVDRIYFISLFPVQFFFLLSIKNNFLQKLNRKAFPYSTQKSFFNKVFLKKLTNITKTLKVILKHFKANRSFGK